MRANMHITRAMVGAVGLTLLTSLPAVAGKVYPVHTAHNFCPTGLQPVTMDGTICCGKPNQDVSYQSVMSHPVKKHKVHRVQQSDCPIGEKGCR